MLGGFGQVNFYWEGVGGVGGFTGFVQGSILGPILLLLGDTKQSSYIIKPAPIGIKLLTFLHNILDNKYTANHKDDKFLTNNL